MLKLKLFEKDQMKWFKLIYKYIYFSIFTSLKNIMEENQKKNIWNWFFHEFNIISDLIFT